MRRTTRRVFAKASKPNRGNWAMWLSPDHAQDALDSDARQRAKLKKQAAEIRDLRALVENFVAQHHHTCRCVACTRLKNWRKP